MTAAEKRIQELLDRWLASVELHTRYLKLDDAAYARAEKWPQHQRPTAWIVSLAETRLRELQAQLKQRRDAGDTAFADALELMSFLTSLLGSEHIERFIPLASGQPADPGQSGTVERPRLRSTAKGSPPAGSSSTGAATPASRSAPGAHKRPARPHPAPPATPAPKPTSAPAPAPVRSPPDAVARLVIADAIRMLQWGREWPTLAGLIARMADRPAEAVVWQILREHRDEILGKNRPRPRP